MIEQSVLGNIIVFFDKIGIFDVVMPFLLVFTIIFAILEKTKVLGTEKVGDVTITKKNLNAMVAFTIAFFVIASAQLVEIVTNISASIIILVLFSVCFLMLIGVFFGKDEEVKLEKGWRTGFMWIMFIGLIFIFMNSIKTKSGMTWLEYSLDYVSKYWSSTAFASIALIVGVIIFIAWITGEKEAKKEE